MTVQFGVIEGFFSKPWAGVTGSIPVPPTIPH
jgi:hypothetical protein